MTDRGVWPDVPPEVPPPWRPGDPPPREPDPGPQPSPPVPSVPQPAGPDAEHGQRTGPFDLLLAHRTVVVAGVLTDTRATHAGAQLMTLNAEGDGPVVLHLNCPDADLDAAFALADTVGLMTVEVKADCRGRLGGPALAVFARADRRVCSPNATFRLREPQGNLSGRADEIEAQSNALRVQVKRLVESIAEASGKSPDRVADDMRSGRILGAEQAVAYGLVDEISHPTPHVRSDTDRSQE